MLSYNISISLSSWSFQLFVTNSTNSAQLFWGLCVSAALYWELIANQLCLLFFWREQEHEQRDSNNNTCVLESILIPLITSHPTFVMSQIMKLNYNHLDILGKILFQGWLTWLSYCRVLPSSCGPVLIESFGSEDHTARQMIWSIH